MGFLPIAAPIIGGVAGQLLGNKGQKQAAQQAADAQQASQQQQAALAAQQFQQAQQYDAQQKAGLRQAVLGMSNQNAAGAAGMMHPHFMAPPDSASFFGGGMANAQGQVSGYHPGATSSPQPQQMATSMMRQPDAAPPLSFNQNPAAFQGATSPGMLPNKTPGAVHPAAPTLGGERRTLPIMRTGAM